MIFSSLYPSGPAGARRACRSKWRNSTMAQQALGAETSRRAARRGRGWSEDWLAVAAGLIIFLLALGLLAGGNLLGWATTPRTWLEIGKSVRPVSQAYAQLPAAIPLLVTYAFATVLMTIGAALLRAKHRQVHRRLHRRVLAVVPLLGARQLRLRGGDDAGRHAALRPRLVAAPDGGIRATSSPSSPALPSPTCCRPSPGGSAKRRGRSSTSRRRSSSSAARSASRRPSSWASPRRSCGAGWPPSSRPI